MWAMHSCARKSYVDRAKTKVTLKLLRTCYFTSTVKIMIVVQSDLLSQDAMRHTNVGCSEMAMKLETN